MRIIIDKSISKLGIESIVIGIARKLDPNAKLTASFLEKQKQMQEWALQCEVNQIASHTTLQGYVDLVKKVGRSAKKNPPTALALIRNIQHRGSIPHINSIIDIYNVETLNSFLAIGGHDLNKINEYIEFKVSQTEDVFWPILSPAKHVAETDYIYRDKNGIMAWLDVRDGEHYKLDDKTKNAIFIIQGNSKTSVQMRLDALYRIQTDLAACMLNLEFETHVVNAETNGVFDLVFNDS